MSTALGENARLHLAPKCLRQQIFVVPKVPALLGQRLRFVIAAERAERATEHPVYDDAAAVERQESALEVHAAMAMFPDALAAPPDRKFYDASHDPSLV